MEPRRVVITGVGVKAPGVDNAQQFYNNLIQGQSSIRNISDTHPHLAGLECQVGNLFKDYAIKKDRRKELDVLAKGSGGEFSPSEPKANGKFALLAMEAAAEAIEDSGLLKDNLEHRQLTTGVAIGAGYLGGPEVEDAIIKVDREGIKKVHPYTVMRMLNDNPAGLISRIYNLHGNEAPSLVAACETGLSNAGFIFDQIRYGRIDAGITGGTEFVGGTVDAPSRMVYAVFEAAKALCTGYNDNPTASSRPCDTLRTGFVPGEGASILVMEELESAIARDARIYAEVIGWGTANDAYSVANPHPEGIYVGLAIQRALADGQLNPEQVDRVLGHLTSTLQGDIAETLGIKKGYGQHAYNIPTSGMKSMTGHKLGAAGSDSIVLGALEIKNGIIAPTINIENQDEHCDLDYVAIEARETNPKIIGINSFGFYGRVGHMILGPPPQ